MVRVTIYVEGGTPNNTPAAQTVDNSSVFRENFHYLFKQHFDETAFELIVLSIGSISQAKLHLQHILENEIEGVLLLDLDAEKTQKNTRLERYAPLNTSRIYFMVQEMEAWILSQPDKLELFASSEGLIRKKVGASIAENSLLKHHHPEDISKPAEKLNTLFRQYYSIERITRGKKKKKPKAYSKTKDGPRLIGLLELKRLMKTFQDVEAIVTYIDQLDNN